MLVLASTSALELTASELPVESVRSTVVLVEAAVYLSYVTWTDSVVATSVSRSFLTVSGTALSLQTVNQKVVTDH